MESKQNKQIKFEHQLAVDIESGSKTATFRFFDDKNLRVGDRLEIVDKVQRDEPQSWQIIGSADVVSIVEKRVADITESDMAQAEQYKDLVTLMSTMQGYYRQPITEETPVKIVSFRYNKYNSKLAYLDGKSEQLPGTVKLYADGGSRGNPGPSAGGFVVLDMQDMVLRQSGKYLGITTNNQAEYHALKGGLELCLKNGVHTVHVYMDSLLVVNQMKHIFQVKNRDLWPIHDAVVGLVARFQLVEFTHVPRELNRLADAEVNKVLDALKSERG